ncbi:MAG: ECF transporter S component [Clostridia bacterium]|nr:ECF transporter S component [Clostridia bacterium]
MIRVLSNIRNTVKGKILLTLAAVVGSVALPQIVHLIGAFSGAGTALGELLLPMHFFVLLAGFLAGPAAGAATGAIAPLISTLLSGMPRAAVLPFMMIELLGYGLIAGLLSKARMNNLFKLLIAQLGGRVLRAGAVVFSVYVLQSSAMPMASIPNMITSGLVGILLQICILPLLLYRLKDLEKTDE